MFGEARGSRGGPERRAGRTVSVDDGRVSLIDLHRPISGDVIDLILADHYLFEDLLRRLRNTAEDRDALRQAFMTLHVAHASAEESVVLPALRSRAKSVTEHEVEHGQEEHAEGHEALLAVMELKGTGTQAFDDALEELSAVVSHHLVEEELTVLNPARDEVGPVKRRDLGAAFATERNAVIDAGVTVEQLRAIVAGAKSEGLLDEEQKPPRVPRAPTETCVSWSNLRHEQQFRSRPAVLRDFCAGRGVGRRTSGGRPGSARPARRARPCRPPAAAAGRS